MRYNQLGHTDIKVSAISLGCEGFVGKTPEETKEMIDFAISSGINFIDLYSPKPDLRRNLRDALGTRRKQFIFQGHLCTSWEHGQYLRTRDIEKVKKSFNEQLEQLGTDYIDVGMIHYVDSMTDLKKVFDGGIADYAQQLKSEGTIKAIGMSSHNPVVAQEAVKSGLIEVLMFSINPCYDMQPPTEDVEELWNDDNYANPLQNIDPQREKLYEMCERAGIGIDVMKVYGGGDLLSETDSPFHHALSPVQCIQYALTRPAVAAVMVGCKDIDQMKTALKWCDASSDELDYAGAIAGMDRFTWKGHCMYCGHCAPCPMSIDIANVNKFLNLAKAEGGVPETVGSHYSILDHHASECIECGACESRCPFGVPIINRMKEAVAMFGK
jgi:predicted aldo/keto reductase-like oxidoreductase